jgi:hypothetical protein
VKTVILGQNSVHRVDTHQKFQAIFGHFGFPEEVLEAIQNGPVIALPTPKSL